METFRCGSWMVLLFLMLLCDVLNHGMVESGSLSPQEEEEEEEDMELERRLKMLNKPPIQTFMMKNGDIVDCVDIYKQPAFDNPLLKDHKLRSLSQSSVRHAISESKGPRSQVALERVACPEGTVPIRRISKEELRNHNRNLPTFQMHPLVDAHSSGNYYGWRVNEDAAYRGATVTLSTHKHENIKPHQLTSSQLMLLGNGTSGLRDAVFAGWFVFPAVYNDTRTRFTIYSLQNGSDCFNLMCSGFVQISVDLYVGSELQIVPGAAENWIKVDISTDSSNDPEWGLEVTDSSGSTVVGYWPRELFPSFSRVNAVARVAAGGNTFTWKTETSPPMGSGEWISKGKTAAAYVSSICILRSEFKHDCLTKDTMGEFMYQTNPDPDCYGVGPMQVEEDFTSPHFYFGGPGGCTP